MGAKFDTRIFSDAHQSGVKKLTEGMQYASLQIRHFPYAQKA